MLKITFTAWDNEYVLFGHKLQDLQAGIEKVFGNHVATFTATLYKSGNSYAIDYSVQHKGFKTQYGTLEAVVACK